MSMIISRRPCPCLIPALNPQDVLENALMGLCGKSGEAIDLLKSTAFRGIRWIRRS